MRPDDTAGFGLIDHVAIAVHDADAAIRRFTALLGYQVDHDETLPDVGVRLVFLAAPGTAAGGDAAQLQLVQPVGEHPVVRFLADHGEGLHHVCWRTSALSATLTAAQNHADGVFTGGRGRPCAFLADLPHGLLVELLETDDTQLPPLPGTDRR